ncbi:MAG TPA: c-type cytochrome [Rhodocyclaceae bacterium]|nr:c-type cytochrome [Rhodocyclaceae bacterium]
MYRKHSRSFVLASMFVLASSAVMAMGASPKVDEEATNARIQPVARVELAPAAAKSASGTRSGEELYKAVCSACHEAGVAGAPKIGDKAAWAPRIALGLDGLLKSATAGKNAMPPKGGAADATSDEMKRAISFMANKAGANFK